METVTITREEYEQLKGEVETLRESKLYQRLLEFEQNISKGRKFTRRDLGF
jgi:PHD/YefM family antitoxin component YafN of YafNO toxin-antitoxin module